MKQGWPSSLNPHNMPLQAEQAARIIHHVSRSPQTRIIANSPPSTIPTATKPNPEYYGQYYNNPPAYSGQLKPQNVVFNYTSSPKSPSPQNNHQPLNNPLRTATFSNRPSQDFNQAGTKSSETVRTEKRNSGDSLSQSKQSYDSIMHLGIQSQGPDPPTPQAYSPSSSRRTNNNKSKITLRQSSNQDLSMTVSESEQRQPSELSVNTFVFQSKSSKPVTFIQEEKQEVSMVNLRQLSTPLLNSNATIDNTQFTPKFEYPSQQTIPSNQVIAGSEPVRQYIRYNMPPPPQFVSVVSFGHGLGSVPVPVNNPPVAFRPIMHTSINSSNPSQTAISSPTQLSIPSVRHESQVSLASQKQNSQTSKHNLPLELLKTIKLKPVRYNYTKSVSNFDASKVPYFGGPILSQFQSNTNLQYLTTTAEENSSRNSGRTSSLYSNRNQGSSHLRSEPPIVYGVYRN